MFADISSMKTMMNTVNSRMEQIHQENVVWQSRFEQIERDCGELKDSVEMAHNLVKNETMKRKEEISSIRKQLVKTHGNQLKSASETAKGLSTRIDALSEDHMSAIREQCHLSD